MTRFYPDNPKLIDAMRLWYSALKDWKQDSRWALTKRWTRHYWECKKRQKRKQK